MHGGDSDGCPLEERGRRTDPPGRERAETRPFLTILGGGASAVLLVAALRDRLGADGLSGIVVVEPAEAVGPGLAYGRADEHHLLNSPAGKMSVSDEDSDGFLRWCARQGLILGAAEFAPRRMYGRYLADTFQEICRASEGRVRHVRARADSVEALGASWRVTLSSGEHLDSAAVVLALGNPAPRPLGPAGPPAGESGRGGLPVRQEPRYVEDPWAPDALSAIRDTDRVLLVGTGLTMVDIATSLGRRGDGLRLTATSRNLLLPTAHSDDPASAYPEPRFAVPSGKDEVRLGAVLSGFRGALRAAEEAGTAWQTVVDGLRPWLGELWMRMPLQDRRRFVRHVARRWEIHRHRMSPAVRDELRELFRSGRLRLVADARPDRFDVVVNCTGPRSVAEPGWNAAIDSLRSAGLLRPDPLGLGIDVDPDSGLRLRSADGRTVPGLYAIGPALRGALWEATAVPEIRGAATAIAAMLEDTAAAEPELARTW